jgi:hypothetical protein
VKKKSIIVKDYRSNYEFIHTERSLFLWLVMLKYALQGARVFYLLSFKQADFIHRWTGINVFNWATIWRTNMQFEVHVVGSEQITYYLPYNY